LLVAVAGVKGDRRPLRSDAAGALDADVAAWTLTGRGNIVRDTGVAQLRLAIIVVIVGIVISTVPAPTRISPQSCRFPVLMATAFVRARRSSSVSRSASSVGGEFGPQLLNGSLVLLSGLSRILFDALDSAYEQPNRLVDGCVRWDVWPGDCPVGLQ